MGMTGGNIGGSFRIAKIVSDVQCTNAEQCWTFLSAKLPSCLCAIIDLDRDHSVAPTINNQLITVCINQVPMGQGSRVWTRLRNGNYNNGVAWLNAYDLVINIGDTFSVVYLEPLS